MKGIFRNRTRQILFALVMILMGTVMAVRFALWGIEEIVASRLSSAIFSFTFACIGLLFGFLSILVFNYNKNARIEIHNEEIIYQCGWNKEKCLRLKELSDVEMQGLLLKLYTQEQCILISNLLNAGELCEHLRKRISQNTGAFDKDAEKRKCMSVRKKYAAYLIATLIAVALMFFHIGWCVWLTDGKDLSDFTHTQDMIFLAFAVVELVNVCAAFALANKCGKLLSVYQHAQRRMMICEVYNHYNDDLDKYKGYISVRYFHNDFYRIVIYTPQEDTFAYMLERFDGRTKSWINCYDRPQEFESLIDLYEELEDAFCDVILDEDN